MLKKIYNKWLYHKYGSEGSCFFKDVPLIFKICPLFSPSVYTMCEVEEWADSFQKGFEEGLERYEQEHECGRDI